MISKMIRCSGCGHEGLREITGAGPVESVSDVFSNQGHDPYSGTLYFRCPQCGILVAVDPIEALGKGKDTMNGCPSPLETRVARLTSPQGLLPVWSGLYTILVLFILLTKISV